MATSDSDKSRRAGTARKSSGTAKARAQAEAADSAQKPTDSGAEQLLEKFAQRASAVVGKSAAILEEEIAAGILAAKQVEEKFINVQALRGGDENRFSRRVRRDIHEVIDIIVDLAESGVKNAGSLAQRAIRVKPLSGSERRRPVPGNIPTLTSGSPLEPGGVAEITMTLENDSNSEIDEFNFKSSDLVNAASGDRIPSEQVEVSPSPVTIAPKGLSKVTIHVSVPKNTAPGVYSGLLQATSLGQLRAILTVQIA